MVKRCLLALNEHWQELGGDWNRRDTPEVLVLGGGVVVVRGG